MRKSIWAVLGALVVAMTLLVACSSADENSSGDRAESADSGAGGGGGGAFAAQDSAGNATDGAAATSSREGAPAVAPQPPNAVAPAETDGGGDDGLAPVVLQQVGEGRAIVFIGSMVVIVEDVRLATQQAQATIAGLGGLVFGQETTSQPVPRTLLTFKVLPEDFQEAMSRLEELGKLDSQQVSADDVTERVVDLESRIITAAASVERLRNFLSSATDLAGVAQLESQLLIRETDLERLRGQLRTLQDQAALATIFLTLIEPTPDAPEARVELVETAYLGTDDGARCPGDDELTIDEHEAMTVCISVENNGNLVLTELEIRDVGLDLDEKDFVVLEGSLAGPLKPGDRLIGYFDTAAELRTSPAPRLSAVAVDEDGEPVRVPVQVEAELFEFDVVVDTSVPSFADGLSRSWDAVKVIAQVGVLAVGVAIPFVWVPLIVVGLVYFVRRMTPSRPAPTPPASTVATTTEGDSAD